MIVLYHVIVWSPGTVGGPEKTSKAALGAAGRFILALQHPVWGFGDRKHQKVGTWMRDDCAGISYTLP